jgi:hypothetical protein
MAEAWFNRGKLIVMDNTTNLNTAVITSGLYKAYTANIDHNTVDQVTTEVTGGGYARQTITSGGVPTQDDTLNRAEWDGGDVTFTNVASGQNTIEDVVIWDNAGAGDVNRNLLAYFEFATINGNGSNITVAWDTEGILAIA